MSWQEFEAEVDHVTRGLLALGLRHGDHFGVWATNWPRWVLLQLASARIGAVMVTVNPANRSSEVAYVLKQSEASALFLVDQFKKSNYFEILADALPETLPAPIAAKVEGAVAGDAEDEPAPEAEEATASAETETEAPDSPEEAIPADSEEPVEDEGEQGTGQ